MRYIPVSRANLKTADFGAHPELASLFTQSESTVAAPTQPASDINVQSLFITMNMVADIKWSSYFSAYSSGNSTYYLLDVFMLVPNAASDSTRAIPLYGSGFRAVFGTASSTSKIGSNIQSFAARGSLQANASQWVSEVYGIDVSYLTATLQALSEPVNAVSFDLNALGQLNQAINDLMTIFAQKPLTPEPIGAVLPVEGAFSDVNLAVGARFAANEIKSGKSLNQALSDANNQQQSSTFANNPSLQIVSLTIATVYKDLADIDIAGGGGLPATGYESPSSDAKSKAGNFLNDPLKFAISGGQ